MKNLNIYITILAVVFASCSDLEEVPTRGLSPEGYFKTAADVESMILGTYGLMASSNYYGNGLTTPLQIMSDMVDLGFDYSNYSHFNSFIHTPTNTYPQALWNTSYQIIATANSAINGVNQLSGVLTEDKANELLAESRFVRAFTYYHLVRLFGDIPYIASVDFGDPALIKKSTVSDVYTEIVNDLEFAFDHLNMQHQGGVKSRPSKGTAATVLASVHMTRANWDEAYTRSKWVIDNAGALGYALENDFQDLWRSDIQASSPEYIFSIDFAGNKNGSGNPVTFENDQTVGAFNGIDGGANPYGGWSMLVPSLKVFDSWDSNDYRKAVSMTDVLELKSTGVISDYSQFLIPRPHASKLTRFSGVRKGNTAGWRSDMDYVVFRYAEVLLIAAEAANELDNTPEAVGYLNQVRERARRGGTINFAGNGYGTYGASASPADESTTISKLDFRNVVLEERRIELAFEFKRWYDIVRRDLGNEAFGVNGLEPQPNFNKSVHYLIPLPQEELDKSPNLEPQNPGYTF
ncbi:RagB/SusD family nutrient uptake outer membrane protein [Reichenbachiella sp. MALMAid0571]|uniref:RagB/SusD family nutrient uptake outer membrane protein n=1 Tax=Reichenbachiella sp. MALMAid0571 TaxID=3143939 RepID=UPI0032DF5841